jgi:hypothetical protein
VKDFWVNGTNYPPGNPPETRWFGEPTSAYFVAGTPDESGGRGKWRLEVSPALAATNDLFFHVLCPRLGREGAFPTARRIRAEAFEGALIDEGKDSTAVFFSRSDSPQTNLSAALPDGQKVPLLVADLAPGSYAVTIHNEKAANFMVEADGVLAVPQASGTVKLTRR